MQKRPSPKLIKLGNRRLPLYLKMNGFHTENNSQYDSFFTRRTYRHKFDRDADQFFDLTNIFLRIGR